MANHPVKLGLMPPLTGLVGIYGAEIERAAQIACQEVNANGGVLGRPLVLIVEDDGSLPESAVAAAERLVDQHRCAGIIGNLLSNSRIAVAYRVAEPRKIPYLNFSFYEGSILSRYFFHFAALPNQQIERMIPCMLQKYGPRMFFAGNNYEWPRGSIDAAKRALLRAGGEISGEKYCPFGVDAVALEHLLDQIETAAPDVFVPYFAGIDQVNLLTRFTQRGLKPRMAVVMGHYDEMMASQLPAEVRAGFYSSNTYFMSVDSAENRAFLARLAAQPGVSGVWPHGNGILTNFGEGAYLCVKAFAQAANQSGSLEPEALVEALKTIQVSGPQGSVRMDPSTHHAAVNTFLARCGADGMFAIVEKFGAIAPVLPERYNHQRISHQATLEDDIRLQARILEQMSEAVFLVNTANTSIVYNNAGAERMFGYGKGQLLDKPMAILNDAAEPTAHETTAEIIKCLNEKGSWQGDLGAARKNGAHIWCSASISTFTHPAHGEVWLAVYRDITQIKQLQQELDRHRLHLETLVQERTAALETAKNDAERANRAKSEFLSHMSHELRTPMNAILGFSQVLESEDISPEQLDFAHEIHRAGAHLLQLINELLDLSRIEAGKMVTVLQPIQLQDLIGDALQMTQALIQSKHIFCINRCDAHASVLADPTRLKQILVNLLSNAAKFNRDGGRILLESQHRDGDLLRLAITDNGPGIPQEKQTQLFKPFERLGAEHTAVDGTGIGLALSKQLAELMGGALGCDSIPGAGSTFWLDLPLAHADTTSRSSTAAQAGASQACFKVLYVEDNAANLKVVEAIFRRQSQLALLSATNGEYGLELARRYRPDAVLLDIHLPGMDGYAVLDALKADATTRDIPVLALSADAMPIDVETGLKAGFVHYLTKPIKIHELLNALQSVLYAEAISQKPIAKS
jgi:PAS domain S-box-containing protein